ncbi:MAG TPA: metalloregulator ArsR/SmtB family transcription factor [Acidimicrobiales bacterium]|nr:metalloregulator ArsR/SmtB family transcription factor [Acidimicrobiales bacterium]
MKDTLSNVFAALGDTTRRGIYEQLLSNPHGLTATALVGAATVSRQAIVKHLQVLARSGLVISRRDGREVLYFVAPDGTAGASSWLLKGAEAWDRRIAKLESQSRSNTRRRATP